MLLLTHATGYTNSILSSKCTKGDQIGSNKKEIPSDTYIKKEKHQYECCKQKVPYCVFVCFSFMPSLYQRWISGLLGHRLGSHTASILALLIFLNS